METVVILLAGIASALAEIPKLIKTKNYKDLIIFTCLLLTGVSLAVLEDFALLPSLSKIIATLIKGVVKIKFGYQ